MTIHKSVLLEESIKALNLKKGDVVVDATLGGGGHSHEILKKIGSEGMLIAIDQDNEAIEKFKAQSKKLKAKGRIFLVNDNFANLDSILKELKIEKVDAILADFGISSDQLEKTERGFSFQKDAPLDMRMNQNEGMTAADVVNSYSEKELANIFFEYGDEKYARLIAKGIVSQRKSKPIETTKELAVLIEKSIPKRYGSQKINPATKVFQALRIEVNKELESIREFIPKAIEVLDKKGRLSVITFHSGEDRIVKEIARENARGCICPPNFPVCRCGRFPIVKIVNSKPIVPGAKEIGDNPRSRSAKLRVVEKI